MEGNYGPVLDDMRALAEQLPDVWGSTLVERIDERRKWNQIISEYQGLKEEHGSEEAHQILKKKYNYSLSSIRRVLYEINPMKR